MEVLSILQISNCYASSGEWNNMRREHYMVADDQGGDLQPYLTDVWLISMGYRISEMMEQHLQDN